MRKSGILFLEILPNLIVGFVVAFLWMGNLYALSVTTLPSAGIGGGTGSASDPIELLHTTGSCDGFSAYSTYFCTSSSKYYKYRSCLVCNSSAPNKVTQYVCGTTGPTYTVCAGESSGSGGGGSASLCNPLTDCGTAPGSFWTEVTSGYLTGTNYECNQLTLCKWQGSRGYMCAKGYYGTANCIENTLGGKPLCSGCTLCPIQDGARGTSVSGNGTTQTDCYKDSTITSTDDRGSYIFTEKCNYSN